MAALGRDLADRPEPSSGPGRSLGCVAHSPATVVESDRPPTLSAGAVPLAGKVQALFSGTETYWEPAPREAGV